MASPATSSGPMTNTAAVLNPPGSTAIGVISWSYSGTLTSGRLTVTDGTTTFVDLDITATGKDMLLFPKGIMGIRRDATFTITLAAGGSGVVGKVNFM